MFIENTSHRVPKRSHFNKFIMLLACLVSVFPSIDWSVYGFRNSNYSKGHDLCVWFVYLCTSFVWKGSMFNVTIICGKNAIIFTRLFITFENQREIQKTKNQSSV